MAFHRSSLLVKRLALNCLSNVNRQTTEHIIRQLTNLTINSKYSENLPPNEIITISISSNDQCQVVRHTNGKYFIPCFELSRILHLNENILDQETVRISDEIFIVKTNVVYCSYLVEFEFTNLIHYFLN